jgi:hypothetical protein
MAVMDRGISIMGSAKSRTREPIDRRQFRLIHALLAFPAAGIIGFAGHTVVKNVVSDSTTIVAPAPENTKDDSASPGQRSDEPDSASEVRNIARIV